jgi:microcystin-dependent protein
MDPFIGEIRIFAGNYAPAGWALCDGSLLSISQNSALYSLLGVMYGGNGSSTFGLPDLRGRVALGMGQGPNLSPHQEGQVGGAESVVLTSDNLPAHAHTFAPNASSANADATDPTEAIPAVVNDGQGGSAYSGYTKTASTGTMAAQNTSAVGSGKAISLLPPYLALNYIIALTGIYPSRG